MKKYITTDKHPTIKEGVEFNLRYEKLIYGYCSKDDTIRISEQNIKDWILDDWLIELPPPEFTKNDMCEFAQFVYNRAFFRPIDQTLNEWIKKQKK